MIGLDDGKLFIEQFSDSVVLFTHSSLQTDFSTVTLYEGGTNLILGGGGNLLVP